MYPGWSRCPPYREMCIRDRPDTPTLIAWAREVGLEARALRLTFKELPRVARALPAILRARDGGALILEEARSDPAKGTVAVIRDPSATDDVVLAIDELHLAEVWEGEADVYKRQVWQGIRARSSWLSLWRHNP